MLTEHTNRMTFFSRLSLYKCIIMKFNMLMRFITAQVYEASASPVTGSGPSVSPSLWTPHASAYAAAPYPSPPTAPQVPQPPYGDPTAFIGPGGPAIYAAPPQFLQDPTIINYTGPAPPFPPPYHAHPQGFQGYAQVVSPSMGNQNPKMEPMGICIDVIERCNTLSCAPLTSINPVLYASKSLPVNLCVNVLHV